MNLVIPQISINGTSREQLVEQQMDVLEAIDALEAAMANALPNGRDYQHDPSKRDEAIAAWCQRIVMIQDLRNELENHAVAIQDASK